jgi:hypothetical protein
MEKRLLTTETIEHKLGRWIHDNKVVIAKAGDDISNNELT